MALGTPTDSLQTGPAAELRRESDANVMAALFQIRTGWSEKEVEKVLAGVFTRARTNFFLNQFGDLVPYTNSALVAEWRSSWTEADGWPQVVFAVFQDTNKTSLIDALWCVQARVTPVVDGRCNRALRSLKKGDSVEKLYACLGRRSCEYFLAPDGKWHVKFIYDGYKSRLFLVEADAADGRISYIGDTTL